VKSKGDGVKFDYDDVEGRKFVTLLNKNASRRLISYNKYKNKLVKFIPLSYNIVLTPSKLNGEVSKSVSHGMEMKIELEIRLYCNLSTNVVHIQTKEFSNIELK
jgi:hypothetical protein